MTVRESGPISFGPADLKRTDRGVTWGVKCQLMDDVQRIYVFLQNTDGAWGLDSHDESVLEDDFRKAMTQFASVSAWFTGRFIPNLNKWLGLKFPITGTVPTLTQFEQADQLINANVAITVKPDGTLLAAVK